jgi:hypothetical protein
MSFSTVDLSTYVRIGRFDLPEPTRTAPPANSLLAQEASAVTYDWDRHGCRANARRHPTRVS